MTGLLTSARRRTYLFGMRGLAVVGIAVLLGACSLRNVAIDQVGNALAGGGTTFAADDDPDLVGEALPFSLKLIESLLAQRPQHRPLLLAAASGFTQYSYGWVDANAEPLAATDLDAADRLQLRARRLYLRARDYGLRGLGITLDELRSDPAILQHVRRGDVPFLFWTASAWGLAISRSKDDPETVADLPLVEALIRRAAELDPDWDSGAIDSFLITWESAQGRNDSARAHFDRAVRLSGGQLASPHVALAEAVALGEGNREAFRNELEIALRVDPSARPEWRVQNLLAQRRAQWLLTHIDDYFLEEEEEP